MRCPKCGCKKRRNPNPDEIVAEAWELINANIVDACDLDHDTRFKLIRKLATCDTYPNLSYGDFLKYLANLNKEQLNLNLTVWDGETDEYMPISDWDECQPGLSCEDILDEGHPFLMLLPHVIQDVHPLRSNPNPDEIITEAIELIRAGYPLPPDLFTIADLLRLSGYPQIEELFDLLKIDILAPNNIIETDVNLGKPTIEFTYEIKSLLNKSDSARLEVSIDPESVLLYMLNEIREPNIGLTIIIRFNVDRYPEEAAPRYIPPPGWWAPETPGRRLYLRISCQAERKFRLEAANGFPSHLRFTVPSLRQRLSADELYEFIVKMVDALTPI
jgi:hypothetical protein